MAAVKLVRTLLVCILLYAERLHIKGMRLKSEVEPDAPDAHIMYDQRQSGKYNIHVVIKDVAIIEMDRNQISDESYNDGEYYYDEEDLTVKPLNIKSTTTSAKPNSYIEGNETSTTQMQNTVSFAGSENVETTTHRELNNVLNDTTIFTTQHPVTEIKSRSEIKPIYSIEKSLQNNFPNLNYSDIPAQSRARDSKIFTDSKIFKVKVHRAHRTPQITKQRARCGSSQHTNERENSSCRGKSTTSGSILKRLFRMLLTLPFEQDAQQSDD